MDPVAEVRILIGICVRESGAQTALPMHDLQPHALLAVASIKSDIPRLELARSVSCLIKSIDLRGDKRRILACSEGRVLQQICFAILAEVIPPKRQQGSTRLERASWTRFR
jgi:hypothetical protein